MYANQCSTPSPVAQRRVGSVESASQDLRGTVERLGAVADELAVRLTPFLRPTDVGGASDKAPDYCAPFAQILQEHDRSFNRIADQLRDLLDRLEV